MRNVVKDIMINLIGHVYKRYICMDSKMFG